MGKADEFTALWSEALHASRWYRAMTVFLAVVVLVLLVAVVVQVSQPKPLPLVVRVDEVGRAEVVDYQVDRADTTQDDPVVGYFLQTFVLDHYARRHALRAERWQRSLNFLTPELQREVYDRDVDELTAFVADENVPEFVIDNVVVRIIPQPEPPFRAEVLFDRVERFGPTELSRERFTLSVHFVFADEVPSEAVLENPLGLVLTFMEVQRQLVGVSTAG